MAIRTATPADALLIDDAPTRPTGGRTTKAAALMLTGIAMLGALAGCGGGSSESTPPGSGSPASMPEASGSSEPPTEPAAKSGDVPTPTGERLEQLLFLLKGTDPGMNTDDDVLASKAVELCGHILKGESKAKIDEETQKLFRNGSFTPEDYQVMAIQLAITTQFCR